MRLIFSSTFFPSLLCFLLVGVFSFHCFRYDASWRSVRRGRRSFLQLSRCTRVDKPPLFFSRRGRRVCRVIPLFSLRAFWTSMLAAKWSVEETLSAKNSLAINKGSYEKDAELRNISFSHKKWYCPSFSQEIFDF